MGGIMEKAIITVQWEPDAKVWIATSEDIPGLVAETDTFEEMVYLLPDLAADLMSENGWPRPGNEPVPLEILAHVQSAARYGQQ